MGRQILVKLLRLLRPEARPDDVAEIVEALLRAEMQDAKSDVKQWITLENGTHVPVGKNGVIQGKGGLSGQKYRPNAGTSPKEMTHAEFSKGVEQGEINTALRRKNGLNKHDRRSSEYNRHNQQRQKEKKPPVSYFTVPDPAALRDTILSDAVQQKAKTLKFPDGTIKQTVRLEFPVGIAYNKKREKIETHWMQVEYAKKHGMHYYPIVPLPGRSDAD